MSPEKSYYNYSKDEFVNDEFFQNWVLGFQNEKHDMFWEVFIREYPEKKKEIEEAIRFLKSVPFQEGLREDEPSHEEAIKHLHALQEELGIQEKRNKKDRIIVLRRLWWAAAVFTGVLFSAYFIFFSRTGPGENRLASTQIEPINDILPGGNKAVLTLSDGTQVILDNAGNGLVAFQDGTKIEKAGEGLLSYEAGNTDINNSAAWNTISTPRGGQYKVILADGSKVWLNAESSLKYPTSFSGNDRRVEIKGEGYFEVAKNPQMPFIVDAGELKIEVLGTEFNVNAYEDESIIKTSLLGGKVEVSAHGHLAKLLPGEQANLKRGSKIFRKVENVDMEQVVAWKNGYFSFDNASLKDVMRQIARWYDVEVEYEGNVENRRFGGGIARMSKLSDVLRILEESNVRFVVKGRNLIVKP